MCCLTHDDRDEAESAAGTDVSALLAPGEQWRCRCGFGVFCQRRATGEDLLCDWCRGTDHERACAERAAYGYGLLPGDMTARPGFPPAG